MGMARVWNDHTQPYSEKLRGEDLITIPAGGYVEMDKADAIIFMGQFVPIKMLDDGTPINPKKLRLEVLPEKAVVKILCQMCKEEFQTDKELALHSELKHSEAMIDDNARKDAAKRRAG